MQSPAHHFKAALNEQGLWSAMRWLNSTVPYRYSAIFGFDGDTLKNVCLVDKATPDVTQCDTQPITDSYCVYIHRVPETFVLQEAANDARVDGHPKQKSFQSYYGVPLFDEAGELRGTVCHFDLESRAPSREMAEALDDLAPHIAAAAFA